MEKAPQPRLAFAETVTAVTSVRPAGVLSGVAATDSRPPASQASAEPQNGGGGGCLAMEEVYLKEWVQRTMRNGGSETSGAGCVYPARRQ